MAVGCAECHTLRSEAHRGTFEHNGYQVHTVVSPPDCATCHVQEQRQYSRNLMAYARKNLAANPVYQDLQRVVLGQFTLGQGTARYEPSDAETRAEACYYCHGTRLEVAGVETRDSDFGEMEFPKMIGWPNQGVGRENLDGSLGACSSCHPRHSFSIEIAR